MRTYPNSLLITPTTVCPDRVVSVPGSKSITNRALVLAAITPARIPLILTGALQSEDTEVMVDCLGRLGYRLSPDWLSGTIRFPGPHVGGVPADQADLFVANSGTTIRFLTAMLAAGRGRYRLDGIPRMRERPIQDLIDAMNQIPGVHVTSEAGTGCPPVIVEVTDQAHAEMVRVKAGTSSQFLSGLLMVGPHIARHQPLTVVVDGPMVSEPYVEMTLTMMRSWGYRVDTDPTGAYIVHPAAAVTSPGEYAIEPDASAASYFFAAAAITGGRVGVRGMRRDMMQGDVLFVDALQKMGCEIRETSDAIIVQGQPLHGIDLDMNAISDTVMSLATVALFAHGPTTIRNVHHIRHKETDRISAIATELRKLGASVDEFPDGLTIRPGLLHGATLETYNDHRMAMSLALVGLRIPGVQILNPGCVAKTYPGFWEDFEQLQRSV